MTLSWRSLCSRSFKAGKPRKITSLSKTRSAASSSANSGKMRASRTRRSPTPTKTRWLGSSASNWKKNSQDCADSKKGWRGSMKVRKTTTSRWTTTRERCMLSWPTSEATPPTSWRITRELNVRFWPTNKKMKDWEIRLTRLKAIRVAWTHKPKSLTRNRNVLMLKPVLLASSRQPTSGNRIANGQPLIKRRRTSRSDASS